MKPLYLKEQSRIDATEPVMEVENVLEAMGRLIGDSSDSYSCGERSGFKIALHWLFSLTPAQLDTLRKQRK